VEISSSLADWAAATSSAATSSEGNKETESRSRNQNTDDDDNDDDSVAMFTPFTKSTEKKKPNRQSRSKKGASQLTPSSSSSSSSSSPSYSSSRRERQAQRQKEDDVRQAALSSKTSSIRDLLSDNDLNVPTLLNLLTQIVQQFKSPTDQQTTTKTFFQNKSSFDYNLAWVGSDDAICHVGTGLHKVPLARLQDIFLTVGNIGLKSKSWRMMEVIRILGPFPNVRNTLLGQVSDIQKGAFDQDGGGRASIKIRYDSIVDGIGKELNAGAKEDTRFVDLDILFVDEEIIICLVPSSAMVDAGGKTDTASAFGLGEGVEGEGGKNILLFLREDELEEKLELMRVAG